MVTLHSVVTEGSYLLSFYYKLAEGEREMLEDIGGVDYTAHASVNPLIEREDRFNCDAGRLPHDLNILMDSSGFVRYSDRIFADFTAMKQVTEVTIEKPSVLRVTSLEPAGIDVDLVIKDSIGVVAQSNAVGGTEGLLNELKPGTYSIEISFVNSFIEDTRHKFCETVIIEIGISPQTAVEGLISHYDLANCINNKQDLVDALAGIKTTLETSNVQINPSNNYFTIPLQSLSIGEEVIFRSNFEVPKLVYSYFEIYSDFILGDLSISLEKVTGKKKTEKIQGTDNALELGEHGRRSFHGELNPGEYYFVIRTGPSARIVVDANGAPSYYNEETDYKILPACVPFQLRIQLLATSSKSLKKWNCKGTELRFLPSTLNTIDKLGVKNTPQDHLPASVFFSASMLAPNSHKNLTDSTVFYLESESIIRVIAESSESPMMITLRKGSTIIASDGSLSPRTPFIYSFSVVASQHSSYKLEIFHYSTNDKCNVYSLLIEILPKSRLSTSSTCTEVSPNEDLITERLLEYTDLFELISEDGYSTVQLEADFQYFQSSSPYKVEIPLEVTTESAMITGHLLSSFVRSGLVIEIQSDEAVIEWGRYKAPHRYELDPIPLTNGKYTIVIKEMSSPSEKLCIQYTSSILMEDIGFWDDISSMIKKTETCSYPDQPENLNIVGQLESGFLHWHKTLQLDVIFGQTFLEFTIEEESVFALYVLPQTNILFQIEVTLMGEVEAALKGTTSVVGIVLAGTYLVEIMYTSDFGLPSSRLCPGFEADLSIVSVNKYNELAAQYSCTSSQSMPGVLDESPGLHFMQFGQISKSFSVATTENSELDFFVSFEAVLSGYVRMELYDVGNRLIERSIGNENWGMLRTAVPAGNYMLKVVADKPWTETCWPIGISYSHRVSEVCLGGVLPAGIQDIESTPYGGPQAADGSLTFHGVFKANAENPKEILKLYAKKTSIVRIMTKANSDFRIESAVYQVDIFEVPVGYSRNRSRFGSYILELPAQAEPYYLVLSHILENPVDCLTYELKVVILTREAVGTALECKINKHVSLLPPVVLDFSTAKNYGSDGYAIFDKWMIGEDLPEGVVSKGKRDSKFVFETTMSIPKKGIVSIESNYDFLTNDITIEVRRDKELLASSVWEVLSDEEVEDTENFSSTIDELEVEPGTYTVTLKQGLASNHLMQRYPDITSCFPFAFYAEFIAEDESTVNTLVSVNPSQLTDQNTLQNLLIFVKFEHPLEESTDLDSMFSLKSPQSTVYPSLVTVNPDSPYKMKIKFSPSSLQPGLCYELAIASDKVKSDSITHQYCTSKCECNPRAKAECQDSSCVCPMPFSGDSCFECMEGYVVDNNSCLQVSDSNPQILAASFNVQSPVQRSQQLRLYVDFTSAPYDKSGDKITRMKAEAIQEAFLLESGDVQIKPYTILPLVKGETKWVLRYASEELEYGKVYTVKIQPELLFTGSGSPFGNALSEVSIEIAPKTEEPAECGGHGIEKGIVCVCDLGYKGADCTSCEKNYRKTEDGICEEVPADLKVDSQAFLVSAVASSVNIIQGSKASFEIELSSQAYTPKGYIIDNLSNSNYIKEAFVLEKISSEKFSRAISVRAIDDKGVTWRLDFSSSDLELSKTYKLVQVSGMLFTASGSVFADPPSPLPRIRVFAAISCTNGVQEQDYCICDTGYKGVLCTDCAEKFHQTLQGECILDITRVVSRSSEENGNFLSTLLYCIGYTILVGLVVYIINGLRKTESLHREFELVDRREPEESEGIDLYR